MNTQNPDLKDNLLHKLIRSPARFFIAVALIILLFFVVEAVSADEGKPGAIRKTLLENPVELSSKNVNTKVIRVTFPPKFKTPMHTHEGPGPRYIVKGKFEVTQDGKVERFSTGEVFWESGKVMQIQNTSDEPAELIIFEMGQGH
jgi:quercetin dioxygenase-like cupin family protein